MIHGEKHYIDGLRQSSSERSSNAHPVNGDCSGGVARHVGQFGRRHRLSTREEQILLRLVLGSHPKVIGESLGCEYETVRTHLRRMQKKLGCGGTRELLVRFIAEL